jgi:biotin carboxyl carrier protein
MDKALTLLHLQKQALQAEGLDAAVFVMINRTLNLIPYEQGVFFKSGENGIRAHAISGNAIIDPKGPYSQFFNRIFGDLLKTNTQENSFCIILDEKSFTGADAEDWQELSLAHNLLLVLRTPHDDVLGCVLFQRAKRFEQAEMAVLEELGAGYAAALALHRARAEQKRFSGFFHSQGMSRKSKRYALLALIALALFPVRLSITAPAEIIAQDSKAITAPFAGMIEDVTVRPGDSVKKGDILAQMSKEELEAAEQSALQALELARISLSRARRESLADPDKKYEISRLQGEIKTREIEYNYAKTLMERATITSPQNGLALFADANSLKGKPVSAGQIIMMIADDRAPELLIRVPVDAMIPLDENAKGGFYPSAKPLSSYKAELLGTTYQASADPDGLMTYKIRARLNDTGDLKIGWKGTAKLYGGWSILSYAVLRRPLLALRNLTGV